MPPAECRVRFRSAFSALGPFDERDHAVEKRFPRIGRDADQQPVREQSRAARHTTPVAAAFADHGVLSPVMALSSTDATPSITSPSAGIRSPAATRTTLFLLSREAGIS